MEPEVSSTLRLDDEVTGRLMRPLLASGIQTMRTCQVDTPGWLRMGADHRRWTGTDHRVREGEVNGDSFHSLETVRIIECWQKLENHIVGSVSEKPHSPPGTSGRSKKGN